MKNFKWVEKDLEWVKKMGHVTGKKQSRQEKYIKQYEKQGWCDAETWSLDQTFAQWITPRLKKFIELNNGYPDGFTEKSWDVTLKKMLKGFEFMASEEYYSCRDNKKYEEANEALALFGKYARDLWW